MSELGRIYPHDYYAYNFFSEDGSAPSGLTDRMKMRMYQKRFEALVDHLAQADFLRVLDVGCADGRLLDWYRKSGFGDKIETHGIEMNEAAASLAARRGHRVVTGRFEVDRALEPGAFDLILAFHVIEHVDDPLAFARRAADLLAPGGLFVVTTPNWDSADARRFKGHWGGNHFPRHWTLFDEITLSHLAMAVGLRLERVDYQPNPIFWVWTCHSWLRDRFPRQRWPDRVFPSVRIFTPSLWTFLLQLIFTVLDVMLRRVTGKTASIAVEMRKPC